MEVLKVFSLHFLLLISIVSLFAFDPEDTGIEAKNRRAQNSRVQIKIGETYFTYEVVGYTSSRYRITVSGYYFNDEYKRYGYAHLFLASQTPIYNYAWRVRDNEMIVEIFNANREKFEYSIRLPSRPRDLITACVNRFNSTALIVIGPSRSQVYD